MAGAGVIRRRGKACSMRAHSPWRTDPARAARSRHRVKVSATPGRTLRRRHLRLWVHRLWVGSHRSQSCCVGARDGQMQFAQTRQAGPATAFVDGTMYESGDSACCAWGRYSMGTGQSIGLRCAGRMRENGRDHCQRAQSIKTRSSKQLIHQNGVALAVARQIPTGLIGIRSCLGATSVGRNLMTCGR